MLSVQTDLLAGPINQENIFIWDNILRVCLKPPKQLLDGNCFDFLFREDKVGDKGKDWRGHTNAEQVIHFLKDYKKL